MVDFSKKNPASCYVELSPNVDVKGFWTGELSVNILTLSDNPLVKESKESLLHLCQLVASTVALMEEDKDFADRLENFIKEDEHIYNKPTDRIQSIDENVIKLEFTPSKGRA